ncbi:GGDEF domain-containing protein [Massilia glaciei]|uniref:diguanylate cyclase n=1 Tax=Massilia glaciei TaxID=1524097 RepID=A0A2U2HKK8_9BURK|nr:GGDEF domain-containing protein [Massilia glaciei]PWF47992.1 GGDEF domain-containing protein [Massilia glaciei]
MDSAFTRQWSLPPEDEATFNAQHNAMIAPMLAVLGPFFGVSILLFTVWDYLIDPGRAGATFLTRLLLVCAGASAYFPTGLRWSPVQRCAMIYATHAGAITVTAAMLEDGLLYGLAGITACLFMVSAIAIRLRTFFLIIGPPAAAFFVLSSKEMTTLGFVNGAILYTFSVVMAAILMLAIRVFRQRAFLSEKKLLYSSRHDSMTGACNQAYLTELAEREMAVAKRHARPLAVAMLDIDHFKRVNDVYGHAVGDEVIRQLVDTCKRSIRSIDHFGRMGGEEFVCVMPETSVQEALTCAERMRRNIEQVRVDTAQGVLSFTASFGVAVLTPRHPRWSDLLSDADTAMYRAKNTGRNRVALAFGEPPSAR